MVEKQITIQNETGLHARPATEFVQLAGKFQSKIDLQRVGEDDWYNAKSIIMLMTLGLAQGEQALLRAEGADEQAAVDALADLVANMKDEQPQHVAKGKSRRYSPPAFPMHPAMGLPLALGPCPFRQYMLQRL